MYNLKKIKNQQTFIIIYSLMLLHILIDIHILL